MVRISAKWDPSADYTNIIEVATPSSLPEKSKVQYEAAFTRFEKWCEDNNIENLDEDTLLAFFEEKAKVQKSSSLWAQYYKLNTVLSMKKNIDISQFKKLLSFLKMKAIGYQPTKTKVLSRHHIDTFLREADDNTFLLMKVVLIIGVAGSCNREELSYLRAEDVKDEGSYIRINISSVHREFIILDKTNDGLNPVEVIRKYVNLRPTQAERFFLAYRNGKCVNQPVGVNTVGALAKKVASFLGLPEPESFTFQRFKKPGSNASWISAHFIKGFDESF